MALANAGIPHETIGFSEIDKYAIQVYERNYPNVKNYGDAKQIKPEELPDFDCLVGGFPCQAFSIAGRRRGFEDTRGTLFFEIARIAAHKKPKYLVLENVKGLLSHDGGRTFQTILKVLADTGYDVSWSIHNSKNYGVPQNRERIYIIGSLRGTSRPEVLPLGEGTKQTLKQIIGGSQGNHVYDTSGLATTIASQAGGLGAKTGLYVSRISRKDDIYNLRETDTSGALTATMHKGIDASGRTGVIESKTLVQAVLTPDRLEKRQNGRRMKEDGEPSFTLNTQDRHGIYDGVKIRRLTPTECLRLQGFPDNWCEGMSDTQTYRQAGNAMTTNVVQHVFEEIFNTREEK